MNALNHPIISCLKVDLLTTFELRFIYGMVTYVFCHHLALSTFGNTKGRLWGRRVVQYGGLFGHRLCGEFGYIEMINSTMINQLTLG